MDFIEKLEDKSLRVAVLGLGYVGLPLLMAFHRAGLSVIGYDVSPSLTSQLVLGQSHVEAVSSSSLQSALKYPHEKFRITDQWSVLSDADAFVICVPTPLTKSRRPDTEYVERAVNVIRDAVLHDKVSGGKGRQRLVVLESTVAPGTTDRLVRDALGFSDSSMHFAFSPERENPGQKEFTANNIPRVVGSNTNLGRQMATGLYSTITSVHTVNSTKVAECAKILENTYRLVNIALINELRSNFDTLGVNIRDVIDAAATKPFGFQRFDPGPGIGGHCIPIDPFYLTDELARYGDYSTIIDAAGRVVQDTPQYVVDRIADHLNDKGKCLKSARILAVGVTYKPDVADTRESPAVEIINILQSRGATVGYYDPHVPDLVTNRTFLTHQDSYYSVDWDAVVILTAHSDVDHETIAGVTRHPGIVLDTRGIFRRIWAGITLPDYIREI